MKNSADLEGCYILRKPNSIIALLFIQNIFFAQTSKPTRSHFSAFFGQRFNNLQRGALLTSF